MSVDLITGKMGFDHITSADDGALQAAIAGPGRYVMSSGNQFSVEIVSNNLIKVRDGEVLLQGRHIRIQPDDYVEVDIDNGTQAEQRHDLIVLRYEKDTDTGYESADIVVLKGTPSEDAASDPEYTVGDILKGAMVDEMPLYRVILNGLSIESVTPLFDVLWTMADLQSGPYPA